MRASSLLWRGQETVGAARLGRQGEGFFFIMEGSGIVRIIRKLVLMNNGGHENW